MPKLGLCPSGELDRDRKQGPGERRSKGCGRHRQTIKHTFQGPLTSTGPFPGSATNFIYSFIFFPKEDLKFHKLQVPQNLILFQVEEAEKMKMQTTGGVDEL